MPGSAKAAVYSYEQDRFLVGSDAMRMMMWPARFFEGVAQADLLQAAQTASPLPLLVLTHALVWSLPGAPWHT